TRYLESFLGLWAGQDEKKQLAILGDREKKEVLELSFQRYFQTSALFSTIDLALGRLEELRDIGVSEIASLVDFGLPKERVMAGLEHLLQLKDRFNSTSNAPTPEPPQRGALLIHCPPSLLSALRPSGATRLCALTVDDRDSAARNARVEVIAE